MKELITPKLIFAIAAVAALSFAIWSGMAMPVETPSAAGQGSAYTTPF